MTPAEGAGSLRAVEPATAASAVVAGLTEPSIAWSSLVSECVPTEERGRSLGRRARIAGEALRAIEEHLVQVLGLFSVAPERAMGRRFRRASPDAVAATESR